MPGIAASEVYLRRYAKKSDEGGKLLPPHETSKSLAYMATARARGICTETAGQSRQQGTWRHVQGADYRELPILFWGFLIINIVYWGPKPILIIKAPILPLGDTSHEVHAALYTDQVAHAEIYLLSHPTLACPGDSTDGGEGHASAASNIKDVCINVSASETHVLLWKVSIPVAWWTVSSLLCTLVRWGSWTTAGAAGKLVEPDTRCSKLDVWALRTL